MLSLLMCTMSTPAVVSPGPLRLIKFFLNVHSTLWPLAQTNWPLGWSDLAFLAIFENYTHCSRSSIFFIIFIFIKKIGKFDTTFFSSKTTGTLKSDIF